MHTDLRTSLTGMLSHQALHADAVHEIMEAHQGHRIAIDVRRSGLSRPVAGNLKTAQALPGACLLSIALSACMAARERCSSDVWVVL